MTVPTQYGRASDQFEAFMGDLMVRLDHGTRHQSYQTLESVLRVFRRRLTLEEGIGFADALPAVLRAIFVSDWRTDIAPLPFEPLAAMNREVVVRRINHDLSPEDAIEAVAEVLARHVDPIAFERSLAGLPEAARAFWAVPDRAR